jgi:hypothetical protein
VAETSANAGAGSAEDSRLAAVDTAPLDAEAARLAAVNTAPLDAKAGDLAAVDTAPVDAEAGRLAAVDTAPLRRPRAHRRVTTQGAPGTDPTPQPEPSRHAEGENDERLKADKPPHWG